MIIREDIELAKWFDRFNRVCIHVLCIVHAKQQAAIKINANIGDNFDGIG